MSGRPRRTVKRPILISSDSEEEFDDNKAKVKKDFDESFNISNSTAKNAPIKSARTKRTLSKTRTTKISPKNSKAPNQAKDKDPIKVKHDDDVSPPKRQKLLKAKKDTNKNEDNIDGACSSKRAPIPISQSKQSYRRSGIPWNEPQLLSELQDIDCYKAANIIKLFNDENTIPFMCRYRKELIGEMSPDKLRDIKVTYNHIQNIKTRAQTIIKNLDKDNVLTDDIKMNLLCAKSLDELDHLYAPYKPASKASLAERARNIGLQQPADNILHGTMPEIRLNDLINTKVEGLETIEKLTNGIKHIISETLSKNTIVLDEIRRLQKFYKIFLQSTVIKTKNGHIGSGETSKQKTVKSEPKDGKQLKAIDPMKFETYFDFKCQVEFVKPHQILAINRGEHYKVLNVKVLIPDSLKNNLHRFICDEYLKCGCMTKIRQDIFHQSFEEAYNKKLSPLMIRHIRSELTKQAEKASIEVFATNLKQLLLMSPMKGEKILGIDPGFANGCKVALVSECSDVLDTAIIYPHTQASSQLKYGQRIAKMMAKYQCELIALGNGTACRETEKWLSDLLANGILNPKKVRYSIVTEQGASIYSCGDVAKKEFPKMDVNLISAVSIARRLQDPLCEFVKVEPKHLGVGMYQHDVNEKHLTESLNEVVMECVSFVGVDINTASATLLRHVAGLTTVRAENIIKYRCENGPFKSREQLKKVKQIGEKTFIQCIGFIRIEPLTAGVKDYNLLDSTWVHPESYDLAKNIIKKCNLTVKQIGTEYAIEQIKLFTTKNSTDQLSNKFGVPEERIKSVLDALQRELLRDYRKDFDKKPLFKQGLTKMSDLQAGILVTGAITNITHFGCFVDIGVENDGLIHISQLGGMKPTIGDRIEAQVINVDVSKRRIQLRLKNIL